jgi:hypothetical protein
VLSACSGLSISPSPNPLKNILQIIEEEPEWIVYDRWGTVLPEGQFAAKIGPDEFRDVLLKYGGEGAVEDWYKVVNHLTKPGTVGGAVGRRGGSCLHRISDAEFVCTVW